MQPRQRAPGARILRKPGPEDFLSLFGTILLEKERSEDFARWQGETSSFVASFPGFVEQRLMPPNPPLLTSVPAV